jgi:ketosteroid isomerase-like protein
VAFGGFGGNDEAASLSPAACASPIIAALAAGFEADIEWPARTGGNNVMDIRRISIGIAAIAVVMLFTAANLRLSSAQNGAAMKQKMTEAQMLDMQKQFEDASIAADAAKVSALMADDAIFVHGSGAAQSKAEYINSLTTGQLKVSTYQMTDGKVVFFDGGAVVSGPTDIGLMLPGGAPPRMLHLRISTVWLAKPSGWQVVLNQGTPIAGPPPAPAH